ncbi:MAG: hypothetical protein ACYDIC_07945 [Desulfobaccales bacterium]
MRGEQKGAAESGCSPFSALPASNLVLIGTVHGDPRGYVRVGRLLSWLRPDVVTVEISRFSLRYRRAWEARWRRQLQKALAELPPAAQGHPALRRVAAQIALPFEYRAARDYSRRSGIKCLPLDLGGLSRQHLPRYGRELLSPANLRALAAEPGDCLEGFVSREFRRARLSLARSPWRLAPDNRPEALRRERFLSRRLQRLAARGGRVAHLGGWEHLVPWRQGEGMRAWLAEEDPCILLADEGDLFLSENFENSEDGIHIVILREGSDRRISKMRDSSLRSE